MTVYYLIAPSMALEGPVELPEVPGLGIQIPANVAQLPQALPNAKPGHAWVWVNGKAQEIPDFRGTVFSTETGTPSEWTELGALPEGLTLSPPPGADYVWSEGAWAPNLNAIHAARVQQINSACEAAITASFQSAALGAPHQYSSQLDDQLNLTGAILRGLDMPYACRDEQGAKAFRLHTAAQLSQVGDDFTLYKLQLLQRANELKQQLDLALAAGDAEGMQAITWEGAES